MLSICRPTMVASASRACTVSVRLPISRRWLNPYATWSRSVLGCTTSYQPSLSSIRSSYAYFLRLRQSARTLLSTNWWTRSWSPTPRLSDKKTSLPSPILHFSTPWLTVFGSPISRRRWCSRVTPPKVSVRGCSVRAKTINICWFRKRSIASRCAYAYWSQCSLRSNN